MVSPKIRLYGQFVSVDFTGKLVANSLLYVNDVSLETGDWTSTRPKVKASTPQLHTCHKHSITQHYVHKKTFSNPKDLALANTSDSGSKTTPLAPPLMLVGCHIFWNIFCDSHSQNLPHFIQINFGHTLNMISKYHLSFIIWRGETRNGTAACHEVHERDFATSL